MSAASERRCDAESDAYPAVPYTPRLAGRDGGALRCEAPVLGRALVPNRCSGWDGWFCFVQGSGRGLRWWRWEMWGGGEKSERQEGG